MPDCHKCPHNGKPNHHCITCKGPSKKPANHGQRFVSLERLPPKEVAKLKVPDPVPENPMTAFMRTWLHLPNKTRNLIASVIISSEVRCRSGPSPRDFAPGCSPTDAYGSQAMSGTADGASLTHEPTKD